MAGKRPLRAFKRRAARERLAQSRHQDSPATSSDLLAEAIPELISGAPDLEGATQHKRRLSRLHGGGPRRPLRPLRHPRARDGRDAERHGGPWRRRAGRRHLSGVLRLHAAVDAHGGHDGPAGAVRVQPRLHRYRHATGRRTSRSSSWPRCGRSPTCWCCARPTRSRRPSAGRSRSSRRTGPSSLIFARQPLEPVRTDRRRGEPLAPRRLRAGGGGRRRTPGHHLRDRVRGRPGGAGARHAAGRRRARPPSSRCRAGSCSSGRTRLIAARSSVAAPCGSRWRRRCAWAGTAISARTAGSSA